jgi:glucose-1-phosphate thymidylyltransferase
VANLQSIVSRLRPDTPVAIFGPGSFALVARAPDKVSPSGLDVMGRFLPSQGRRVRSSEVDGWRGYHGDPHDLLEVNRLALDALGPGPKAATGSGNRIEGRVQIDPGASVTRSVIVGPAVVGAGAEVTNAYIGPYTSIGAEAVIEGAEIERSIISPGARVVYVGARLVSSFVGRQASVFRDFSLPRAVRLQVGDGNEVALC